MILVVSKTNDISTDYFMEWCDYMDMSVSRINEHDAVNLTERICLDNGLLDLEFRINGEKRNLNGIDATWFRRGYLYHCQEGVGTMAAGERFGSIGSVDEFLKNENKTLNEFLIHCLKKKNGINEQDRYNANKLICLLAASEVGLNIPFTLIAKDKDTFSTYFDHSREMVISKPIQDSLHVGYEGEAYHPVANSLAPDAAFPDHFFYSKFQKGIEKKFEVRTFFLGNMVCSCAVFTPDVINNYQELRIVPFTLPAEIRQKVLAFACKMNYESGSIDILVDRQNEYYFLEINPVGQYDFVGRNCNFYLDYEIAKFFQHYNEVSYEKTGQ